MACVAVSRTLSALPLLFLYCPLSSAPPGGRRTTGRALVTESLDRRTQGTVWRTQAHTGHYVHTHAHRACEQEGKENGPRSLCVRPPAPLLPAPLAGAAEWPGLSVAAAAVARKFERTRRTHRSSAMTAQGTGMLNERTELSRCVPGEGPFSSQRSPCCQLSELTPLHLTSPPSPDTDPVTASPPVRANNRFTHSSAMRSTCLSSLCALFLLALAVCGLPAGPTFGPFATPTPASARSVLSSVASPVSSYTPVCCARVLQSSARPLRAMVAMPRGSTPAPAIKST
jgi:hypothetical protein